MVLRILNYLHGKGFYGLLNLLSRIAYFIKGYGTVEAKYLSKYRAYKYKVRGITYLSMGPGWSYSYDYLKHMLEETFCFQYKPKKGDCVVDIGAGLGEETVVFAMLVEERGLVHSIEANLSTYSGLEYMCKKNNFTWVKTHHLAIYNLEGEVTIEDDEKNYLTNTIGRSTNLKSDLTVSAKTFDSFVKENGIDKIDLLKVNIEGAEQFLIEGMINSLFIINNLCISCHDFRHLKSDHGEFYMTKEKVIAFLTENGFIISVRNTGNSVIDDFIYAKNPLLGYK